MKFQGRLNNWNDKKGFGFVEPNGGGNRCFVHIKSFKNRAKRPSEGDLIIYEQVKETNGKFKAINITFVSDKKIGPKTAKKTAKFGTLFTITFSAFLVTSTVLKWMPIEVLCFYAIASALVFILYALDKSAAIDDRRRTPESQLHLISLIGGWPGAFCAQQLLRHKSSKREFKRVYWATVIINITAFAWLFTEEGSQLLNLFSVLPTTS